MIIEIISYIASGFLLASWAIAKRNIVYSAILNIIGSGLMSYYGFVRPAFALVLLNIPFGLISLYYILKRNDKK